MKLISTEVGQSFQPHRMEEIRPWPGVYLPGLIGSVAERYRFARSPKVGDPATKFEEGWLGEDEAGVAIKELGIYTDGIIVSAWDTDFADAIVDDVQNWLAHSLKFREPVTKSRRIYTSSVVVALDVPLDRPFSIFADFVRSYESALKDAYGPEFHAEATRIAFGVDPARAPQNRPIDFAIERRLGISFSECRYFSMAPFQTKKHLEVLSAFEKFLLAMAN